MSFFGFDTSLPRDKPQQNRGLFDRQDPFAGLGDQAEGDGEVLDFEETYDGLGQQLQESGDTFNDDTFGGSEPVTQQSIGKDFDFAGQTAAARGALVNQQQQQQQYDQQRYYQPVQKPKRSGYEAYKEPEYVQRLEADASIWGYSVAKKAENPPTQQELAASRKMMSLDEVEAMMRSQPRPAVPVTHQQELDQQSQGLRAMLGVGVPQATPQHQQPQILQRSPAQQYQQMPPQQQQQHQPMPDYAQRAPQILQRQSPHPPRGSGQQPGPPMPQHLGHPQLQQPQGPPAHTRGQSLNAQLDPRQIMQMTPQERDAYLAEEAKRAKRNHKIFLLSKHNGIMTPQDKNFITRIQLQQLLTATGGVDNVMGSDEQLSEDFYYQVYAHLRGPPASGPNHALSQFAQTYLFQTSSRYGYGRGRHHPRGGDNHVQRMEQQVARAVEAAKARPKNKSLAMEGSLGKIAFSNSKTPRPLLNIKQRPDSEAKIRAAKSITVADRKATLKDIEEVYTALMKLEDHERKMPPPPNEESPPEIIEAHMQWRSEMAELNAHLWAALKVMAPVQAM